MHVRLWQPHFVFAVCAVTLRGLGTWSYFIPYVESATGVGDKAAARNIAAAFAVGRFGLGPWLMRHFHARLMLVLYSRIDVAALCLVAVVHPVGWAWAAADDEPFYVDHVSNDLCPGT